MEWFTVKHGAELGEALFCRIHLVYVCGRERLNGVYGGTLGRPSNSDKFLKRGRLEGDASRVDGTVMGGDLGK